MTCAASAPAPAMILKLIFQNLTPISMQDPRAFPCSGIPAIAPESSPVSRHARTTARRLMALTR